MANNTIKGITIEIGGNTAPLNKALSTVNQNSRSLQNELKSVEKLLQLDPTNTELVAQKQKLLAEAVNTAKTRLDALKQAQEEVNRKLASGEIDEGSEEYRAFQRQVISAEQALQQAEKAQSDFADECANAGSKAEGAGDAVEEAGKNAKAAGEESEKAGDKAKDSGDKAKEGGNGWQKFGELAKKAGKLVVGAAAVGTAAATAVAKSSVEAGMQFDTSMSQVAATMGYTVEELNATGSEASKTYEQLRNFAMEMGSSTAFSASEAADALNYMALAGYDAKTSISMLPNVLNLAAAGGIDLAAASDMVTDAQSALGLTLDETSELVDKMARASSKSNTSVEQLGSAILTIGGTAKNLAGGTTELATSLGILADNGIKGSEGGTKLRNAILSLTAPTKTARVAMEQLGLEVFDAEGNMRPLNETFADLNDALSSMTQGEQTEILSKIFNKADLKAINALLATSAERWDELSENIDDASGAAAAMADTQLDNLAGDITMLESATEGAKIAISDQLTPSLREFVQFGTKAVGKLTSAFQDGGLSGAMGALGEAISEGLAMAIEKLPNMVDAGMQLLGALGKGLIDNLPVIAAAAVEIVTMLATNVIESFPMFIDAGLQIIVALIEGIVSAIPQIIQAIVDVIPRLVTAITDNLPLVIGAGITLLLSLAQGLIDAIPQLFEALPTIIDALLNGILGAIPQLIDAGIQLLTALVDALPTIIETIVVVLPQIVQSIVDALKTHLPMIVNAGIQLLTALVDALPTIINAIVAVLPVIIDAVITALLEALPLLIEAGITLLTALVGALPQIIQAIVDALPTLITGIIDALLGNLPLFIQAGIDLLIALVEALPEIITTIVEALPKIITSICDALIGNIDKIIMAGVQLFVALVENTPKIIVEIVKAIPKIITGLINAIIEFVPKIAECGLNLIQGLWNGISDAGKWLWDKISGFFGGIVDSIKGFFGIHSPSTLFRDMIGKNLVRGIEVGVDVETPNLRESLEDNLASATAGLKASVESETMKIDVANAAPTETQGISLGGIVLNIENFVNNTEADIHQLTEEVMQTAEEFIRRRGGVFA